MELNGRPLTTRYPNTTDLHFPFGKSSPVVTLAMRRTPRGLILGTFGTRLIGQSLHPMVKDWLLS